MFKQYKYQHKCICNLCLCVSCHCESFINCHYSRLLVYECTAVRLAKETVTEGQLVMCCWTILWMERYFHFSIVSYFTVFHLIFKFLCISACYILQFFLDFPPSAVGWRMPPSADQVSDLFCMQYLLMPAAGLKTFGFLFCFKLSFSNWWLFALVPRLRFVYNMNVIIQVLLGQPLLWLLNIILFISYFILIHSVQNFE